MTDEQAFADFQRNWQKTCDPPDEERYPFMCGFDAGAAAAQRPIPVTERLPDYDPEEGDLSATVACWNGDRWACGWFNFKSGQWSTDSTNEKVTHWLPLPAAPERT